MEALELVENIRRGRDVESSQEELYTKVREALLPRIERKIPNSLRPRLDSEDVLHDAFLRALGALGLFNPSDDRAFYAWIYSIAKNLLIDTSRRRSVGNVRFVKDEAERGPRVTWVKSPQRRAESLIQRKDYIQSALSRLKEKEREIIRLHKLQGLSFQEIAESWGKTPGAVQRFYSRALQQLRAAIAEAQPAEDGEA